MERLKILTFRIRDRYFAFVSKNAKEIIDSYGNLKTVFYGGRALKGLISFEGEVVSVLDAAFILGIKEDGEDPMILLCKEKGMNRPVGITVSEIRGMEAIDTSRIAPMQDQDQDAAYAYIVGFIKEEDKDKDNIVTLIDLGKFFDYADSKIERF